MIKHDKLEAYAMAADDDIAAVRFEQVRASKLWRGYMGTVYGCKVAATDQVGFDTYEEARADAMKFVEKCADALNKRKTKEQT